MFLVSSNALWTQAYAPTIFSRIVMAAFKYFVHKFLEVYLDDQTIFGLIKDHIESLRMMLERCQQYHNYLNLKKCIYCAHFGIMLGHVVCHNGILVDPSKIVIMINLPPLAIVKQLRVTLGHTRYY